MVASGREAEPSIVVEGVDKRYKGGVQALTDVNLRVGRGLFGLLGPNGAGKSTLMKIICTLLEPTSGRVEVCEKDVTRQRRAVRALIGYLPQEFGAWRLHRVEEVLDTVGLLAGLRPKAHRRRRVAEVLEAVGLDEVADQKVKHLSGGMVRRLGVAQAPIHEPPVLVVDEPTVGLDPEERIRFRGLMSHLGEDRAILLSTHIVADLGQGCSRLALLDRGRIVHEGSPVGLISASKGRVFEVPLTVAETAIGLEEVSRSGQVARVVLVDGTPPPEGRPVDDPSLEEAYLAFMVRQGSTAALAEQEAAR